MKTTYKYCPERKRLVDVAELAAPTAEPKYDPAATYDEYLHGPKSGTFMKCDACGDFHEVSNWPANHMPEQFDLAHPYAGVMTISDTISFHGVQSQADGRMYDSKSKLRADYRARGLIEVGNDAQRMKPFVKPKPDRKKIKETLHRAMYAVQNEGARSENFRKQSKTKTAFGAVNSARSR